MSKTLLKAEGLAKVYHQAEEDLTIFKDINLEIKAGEIVALVGPSGAGKSTLLQLIGLLDQPTSGKIEMAGRDVSSLGDEDRTLLRRHYVGFVYQFHFLQPEFSALENVMLPQIIKGASKSEAKERATALLTTMGLGHRLTHRPGRLSGGEQQRVAIARSLANEAKLLLADEPTGNLDPKTSGDVFDLLIDRVRSAGIGAVIATHNMELASRMDRILEMKQGQLRAY
ncbi:MAG: ABC transporter ATP-binding protein [Alphaproteobacteria bacterium]|jgi:lipoprotein-releasing system ATP-binding protein|nr:ABC transporter ATP-binding protein [Alphaproteobacteria bacterium]MBP9867432.1 ABC transporter ATP-binding protein [Alphaproteobacteria bacterium]